MEFEKVELTQGGTDASGIDKYGVSMSDFDIIKIQTSGIHVSRIHIDGINANENIAGGHHAG